MCVHLPVQWLLPHPVSLSAVQLPAVSLSLKILPLSCQERDHMPQTVSAACCYNCPVPMIIVVHLLSSYIVNFTVGLCISFRGSWTMYIRIMGNPQNCKKEKSTEAFI